MKALVCSDLHGHNFKEFSYINDAGVNSRLNDQAVVLHEIHESALKQKVDCVIFLGDFTHLKNNVDSQVIKILGYELGQMAINFPIYILPGNHDFRLWGSEPALLEVFEDMNDRIHILEKGWETIFDHEFYCLPYTRKNVGLNEELNELDTEPDTIFLGHKDIIGVKYGKFLVEKGLNAQMLSKKFRLSLIGHFHSMHSVESNVFSVGAPMQHNFSDTGEARGWWVLDTVDMSMEFVTNTFTPSFFDIKKSEDSNDKLPGDPENDFYRIHITGSKIPKQYMSARWKRVSFSVGGGKKSRSQITFSDTDSDLIKKYVESRSLDTLDPNILIELGRKYL